ncbi:MAG: ATP-binding protein [bacterium]|nr:ATP-binding protein [bacterium]
MSKLIESFSGTTWLLRLRLVAFFGQLWLVLLMHFVYGVKLPIAWLVAVLTAMPLAEQLLLLPRRFSATVGTRTAQVLEFICRDRFLVAALLLVDVVILTAVLALTGGASNPFSIVYLVQVVIAAIVLGPYWAWGMALLTSVSFASLFFLYLPLPGVGASMAHHQHGNQHGAGLSYHLQGMFISYVLVAFLCAYFLAKIAEALAESERKRTALLGNQQRLAAMTALSAGAAHELGTPLSSIQLIASELERALRDEDTSLDSEVLLADVQELQQEVRRCSSVIDDFCACSGNIMGEHPALITVPELVEKVLEELLIAAPAKEGRAIINLLSWPEGKYSLQVRPTIKALAGLLKNGIEACQGIVEEPVLRIAVTDEGESLKFVISDNGKGMSTQELEKVEEPFFTTKQSRGGMGLGIYIARLVAEQQGGQLSIRSEKQKGTEVEFSLKAVAVSGSSHGYLH